MNKKEQLLLVDDERQFSLMTKEYLEAKGFVVSLCHSGEEGLNAFKNNAFDLCILDVKMPIKDGFSLAEDIRKLNAHIPFVFLSGKTEKEDRIKGLLLGADDYITKPFSVEELFLRIKAILKRSAVQNIKNKVLYKIGKYSFDVNARELVYNTKLIKLSAIETKLLDLFCENLDGLVERDLALKRIWHDQDYLKGRSLNVYVSRLRNYLSEDHRIEILNVHGEGYRMIVKEEEV